MIDRALRGARQLSQVLVWIGGGLILASAVLVTIEVFVRKFLNVSLGGADELSGYAFGVATTCAFAYALFERAHIRVDALYSLFPRALRLVLSAIGLGLLLGFAGVASWMAWSMVADTLQYGSRSITPMRVPLAIPQIPWLFGWIFFRAGRRPHSDLSARTSDRRRSGRGGSAHRHQDGRRADRRRSTLIG